MGVVVFGKKLVNFSHQLFRQKSGYKQFIIFIMRRLKKDVLKDLPDKLEKVCYAAFDTKQQKLYDGQVVHMQAMLEEQADAEFGQNKLKILAELTRLRQVCCDPSLLYEAYDGGSAKREACMELISQAIEGGHRMLIFSQFTSA